MSQLQQQHQQDAHLIRLISSGCRASSAAGNRRLRLAPSTLGSPLLRPLPVAERHCGRRGSRVASREASCVRVEGLVDKYLSTQAICVSSNLDCVGQFEHLLGQLATLIGLPTSTTMTRRQANRTFHSRISERLKETERM